MSASASSAATTSTSSCSKSLITAFELAFDNCSDATGVTTTLGIVQPSAAQKTLICTTPQCEYLYSLFEDNEELNCSVGTLITLTTESVDKVLSVCAADGSSAGSDTTGSAATPTATTATPAAETSSGSGAGTGVIIGAACGGMAFLVIVYVLFLWCRRLRQKRGGGGAVGGATVSISIDKGDHYELMATTPRTEPTDSGPWSDPAITAMRIPFEKVKTEVLLSQGAYGEVYRGLYNGEVVAVKKILPVRRRILSNIHSFLEEIKLTATLEHTCIVRFIGVAWDSLSDLSMITEFMPGGDLRQLLNRFAKEEHPNGFDYDKIKIAVQIAHALTYLHSLQPVLVHRDLKSRNILLSAELDAKLVDFGVSRERRDLTMTAGVGSSLWMAPEVMLGERYDERADVFSFGVVLSELDTHAVPYAHAKETNSERKMAEMVVMQLVSQGQLCAEFSDAADPEIVALARDCLALEPAARPSSAEALHRIHTIWKTGALV